MKQQLSLSKLFSTYLFSMSVKAMMPAILIWSVSTACSPGQSNPDYSEAKKTFESKYPAASSVNWNKDDHGNLEAQFKMEDEKYRADFEPSGKWIETEQSIKWSDLPKIIKDEIEKSYDKKDVAEIEMVDHHSKGKFYDVEIKQKGKNLDMEYNAAGKQLN